jgi:two-component system sensor histidine kinase DegS
MIGVANRPFPYDDEHEQLLMTYAAQVAIVIRNAQLYEQLKSANEKLEHKVDLRTRQLEAAKEALADKAAKLQVLLMETFDVQERERQRIAQDMHDGMNQLLIGAMLELKSAHQRLANDNLSQAEDSLQTVQTILRRVESEIKHVIYDLRPPTLDALGLAPAVRRYAERFEGYSDIPCKVTIFGEPRRLRPNVEISVYRLLQEALQNVSSHAGAKHVDVIVAFALHKLKLTILDNGRGFDLAQVESNGNGRLGLLGMRERAESLGGRVAIETAVGQGTRVELVVPILEEGVSSIQ